LFSFYVGSIMQLGESVAKTRCVYIGIHEIKVEGGWLHYKRNDLFATLRGNLLSSLHTSLINDLYLNPRFAFTSVSNEELYDSE